MAENGVVQFTTEPGARESLLYAPRLVGPYPVDPRCRMLDSNGSYAFMGCATTVAMYGLKDPRR